MDVGLVCDSCSAFNPMGTASCTRCGTGMSLDESARRADADAEAEAEANAEASGDFTGGEVTRTRPGGTAQHGVRPGAGAPTTQPCPACSVDVVLGHKFCWSCGYRMSHVDGARGSDDGTPRAAASATGSAPAMSPIVAASASHEKTSPKRTMFFGAMQATRAKLVLIKGDGLDGISFTLAGEEHVAGRIDCPLLFEEDPFLSPVHANFFYRNQQLVVRDEGSVNGVFIRIRGSTDVRFDARFLVGEQVLEVQAALGNDGDRPADDGTYFFASPRRPSNMRVVQALRGGDTGLAYRAPSDVVSVGREGNDINFPDDPFISGHHAQITFEGGRVVLTDLNSKNGTFLRIGHEHVLKHGDYVFMGQQLLRVEIV
jgi:pSer/pThr/pTyr-binding forkhead associated (FHA) protein